MVMIIIIVQVNKCNGDNTPSSKPAVGVPKSVSSSENNGLPNNLPTEVNEKFQDGAQVQSLQGNIQDILEKGQASGIDPIALLEALKDSVPESEYAEINKRLEEQKKIVEQTIKNDESVQLEMLKKRTVFNVRHPHDTQYVLCEACRAMVGRAHFLVSRWRDNHKTTKLKESDVSAMIDNICKEETEQGDWIREYAVVESDNLKEDPSISITRMGVKSFCEEGCWVLEEACYKILDASETDLIEQLWRGKLSRHELVKLVCEDNLADEPGGCGQEYPAMSEKRKGEKRPYPFREAYQVKQQTKRTEL